MTPEQVCGSSRYARVICASALLAFVAFIPSTHAQQSYRTQQSNRPSPAFSQPGRQVSPPPAKTRLPHVGRFLGWRAAAKDGPQATRYFHNLEQQSYRIPGASLGLRAAPHPADNSHPMQRTTFAASPAPASLPGISLRASFPAGALPSGVATGDFNGDGKLDWVVSNAGDNSLDLYLGNGDGTARLPIIIPLLGQSPVAVAAADLNGDKKLDLVVAESDSGTIGVLLGNGDGTFQPEIQISLLVAPVGVAVADVNGDGHPDLLVGVDSTDSQLNYFATLLNNGSGHFGSPIFAPNPTPNEFVDGDNFSVADVNGDGIPDVLVAGTNAEGTVVQMFIGKGDGTFTPGQLVDESGGPDRDVTNAVLADVNGDGCPDVVDVDTIALVHIFPGDCKGNFDQTNFQVYGVGDIGFGLAVADVNGDGQPDIIVGGIPGGPGGGFGNETGNTVTVRFGDGKGHFGPAQVYRGDPGMFALTVADLGGTGHPDVITANQNANTTTVYVNNGSGNFGQPQGGYDGFEEGSPTSPTNSPNSRFVVADIDGDGKPDLGLVELGEGFGGDVKLAVMLNQGNGRFSTPILSAALGPNTALSVGDFVFADFRKSGKLDFLTQVFDATSASPPQLLYAQNTGNGQFGAAVSLPFTTQGNFALGAIGVGDFNKDGNLDFAVATSTGPAGNPDQLTVYLGHGDGTFTQSYQVNFGSGLANESPWPQGLWVGDANGDGKPDIYVWVYDNVFGPGAPGGRDLFQLLGNGDGTFQTPRDVLQNLSAMTMADLNHDGRPDVIDIESASTLIAEGEPGTAPPQVNVYLGQANGNLGAPTTYAPYTGIFETFTGNNVTNTGGFLTYFGDFNGDGNPDVAVFQNISLSGGPSYVQFLMGNADGTFTPTYDAFNLGIQELPDVPAPNLLGDGRAAFLQTPNYTSSYQVIPAANAPSFQIQPAETPVLGSSDSLGIALDLPSASDTVVSLSASDPGVQIAPSVTIPAGQLSVQVPFTLGSGVIQNRWFSLTAKAAGDTQIAYDFPGHATASFTQIVAPPPLNTVQPGEPSELWSAGVQSNGDASGTFQTSCQGLPAGMTCQFQFGLDTFTVLGGGFQNVVFQIAASSTTAGGTYKFNIVSTDGETILTAPETLQVVEPPPPMPGASFNPVAVAFPPALVGSTQTQTVILSNNGAGALNVAAITIPSGANAFTQSNTCGTSLAANTTCMITITLNTASTGSPTGSLSVADNASGSPQKVSLSALIGDLALQPGTGAATTMTVPAGTSAVFSLQLVPNILTGTVAMGCTGAIAQGTCTVQPASLSVDGKTPQSFQVTVTSTARTGAGSIPQRYPQSKLPLVLGLALLLLFTAAARANFRGSANGQLTARYSQAAALLLTGALLLASCGGGGTGTGTGPGSGGGNSGTPAGTYAFTVTASSGGGSRSLPITLVVQ
jgi:FG-GAP-like repeat/Abnormal spindle-like microcephaly-assoc'd, ASPM-SPD-2-Hydin